VEKFEVGNAVNLSALKPQSFDAVFSCGPFYHLVDQKDRVSAAREAIRVCKAGGMLIIGFIPRFSGLAGLLNRAAQTPEQVSGKVFEKAAKEGVFHNASSSGFQEGYYPTVREHKKFWKEMGLSNIEVISTRSFMHQNERHLLKIRENDKPLFECIIEAHRSFAKVEGFIEAGGHALLVGKVRD